MRPADLRRVVVVEELSVDPSASFAVVSRRVIRRDRYERHLWWVDLTGRSRARQLTSGSVLDGHPAVSPDGRLVAFVRSDPNDDDAPNGLFVARVDGRGAPRRLAPRGARPGFEGISEIAWSPDGRRVAFVAGAEPLRSIVGNRPAAGSAAARASGLPSPIARRITRADWRWDGTGHRDRWSHAFVVELSGGSARQVTDGSFDVTGVAWHPDARTIAVSANLADDADLSPFPSIWSIDVDAGPGSARARPRVRLDAPGGAVRPAWSPDGRWLAAVGSLRPQPFDDVSAGLLIVRADGSTPPAELQPDLDRPWGNVTDTDLDGWMVDGAPGPFWLDRRTIVGVFSDRGRSLPARWRIDPSTGALVDAPTSSRRAAHGPWADATTHALAVAPRSARPSVVFTLGTLDGDAMDVRAVDLDEPEPVRSFRPHTTFGSSWQRRFVRPDMRRLDAPGAGGPIETWLASPPGAGDDALPTVVDVHGGPLGCWAPSPHLEVTMLVGAGYRVVLPNIRGSGAYGGDWIRPQLGDWGGVDADDVHAALDHVIALGLADPNRLGVLGLSYGGFMVNWLVGTSDRFRAAVSENGVSNQVAAWAGSDSGPEYCRAARMGDPFTAEGVEQLWQQSPLRHVASIRTPLLMLQAEADHRCPPSDNEQLFVALRHLRRDVEYVLYPDESHVYAADGRPDRRIDRMTRVLDWFDRHLVG
jgi:dipeptidyl aminopeptidase/acylaminoacyl peptidase